MRKSEKVKSEVGIIQFLIFEFGFRILCALRNGPSAQASEEIQ